MSDDIIQRLESDIDAAGRDKVFALMRAAGWGPASLPPIWVWELAVSEIKAREVAG